MQWLLALAVVLFGSAFDVTGCGSGGGGPPIQEGATRSYTVQGEIQSISDAKDRASIAHEEVEGYMPAMTMTFFTQNPTQLEGLAAGDRVEFTFQSDGRHVITAIRKL